MGKNSMKEHIEDFLKTNNTHMYKNHCNKFLEYLNSIGKQNEPLKIHAEDLFESVGYYNDLGQINKISTMENHLESIKAFYTYSNGKSQLTNIFNEIQSYSKFKSDITKKFNLNDTNTRNYLSNKTIIAILSYLNDDNNSNNINTTMKIFIKISLLAPSKRNIIANLKFKDFCNNFKQLKINNIKIQIPELLQNDILKALDINKITELNNKKNDLFFESIYEGKFNSSIFNKPLCTVLKKIKYDLPEGKKSYPVEEITNAAIINMVQNKVNPILISQLAGITVSRLVDKLTKLNINYNFVDVDKVINNSIMNTDYYTII